MKESTQHYTGTRLFEVLEAQGRSQVWIARQAGVSRSYVSHIKAGRFPIPKWFAERVAAALGMPESILFFGLVLTDESESNARENVEAVA